MQLQFILLLSLLLLFHKCAYLLLAIAEISYSYINKSNSEVNISEEFYFFSFLQINLVLKDQN